jgi:hypothetical protein
MKKLYISSLTVICVLALTVVAMPSVLAHDEDETTTTTETEETSEERSASKAEKQQLRAQAAREKAQQLLEAQKQRQDARQAKLSDAKLKLCEAREKNIETIMNRAITRGQNQIRLFGTIAERVKTFYTDKGIVVDNYDALVAAIDTAKTEAETDLEVLKTLSFNCDSDDPKAEVAAFKDGLEEIRHSLKDYRTAVKNLIVGVKSAQGEES